MATKRACKLQEFVAHASDVNCVKFGRKTSRMLITGGEDQKVNLWVVGKPSKILSLSGLTSPVESVSFDSSEVMIGAGAASGTIKIWDVEEAKVVRTFTGHRSNCASLDFHPFGEFFASGSSDTNMKIWDNRKKRCIHTYKGHTRRIDVLRFTPDGRWIVSGGADNSVKIWDLTAGKLLNDFRLHGGPVNCLDFHPHEFLLATGSADRTVKFWDLETFELIGSSGPETSREYFVPASVVRSLTFNSDGKSLFCGLHESLKVLSWEPIVCHDVLDVSWSILADLNVLEGKLLGCSYYQNCVGVWVVDLMQIRPYATSNAEARTNGSMDSSKQYDNSNTISSVLGRLSVTRSKGETSGCTGSVDSNEAGGWLNNDSGFEIPNFGIGENLEFTNMNRRSVFGMSQLLESSKNLIVKQRLSSADYERRQHAPTLDSPRRYSSVIGELNTSASDEDAMADLLENHQEFIHLSKSRLTKLEVVYRYWQNNDIKGSADVMQIMSDHAVTADIISALIENSAKHITLDICASVLALASSLLESTFDRHMNIGLEMILKLVKYFGATISSTMWASPPICVDLEAEKRLEQCKLCFKELNKVNAILASLARRHGKVGRSARELSLCLQDIFQLSSR